MTVQTRKGATGVTYRVEKMIDGERVSKSFKNFDEATAFDLGEAVVQWGELTTEELQRAHEYYSQSVTREATLIVKLIDMIAESFDYESYRQSLKSNVKQGENLATLLNVKLDKSQALNKSPTQQFIDDCLLFGDAYAETDSELWKAYEEWALQTRQPKVVRLNFMRSLEIAVAPLNVVRRKSVKINGKHSQAFCGLKLKTPE